MFNNKVYHKIDALSGSVATLRADGVKYNEIAEVESRAGVSLAQVIKLDGDNVTLQIFAGARGVDTAAKVRFLGETMKERTRLPMQETQEMRVRSLGGEDALEEEMATHSSTLTWKIL